MAQGAPRDNAGQVFERPFSRGEKFTAALAASVLAAATAVLGSALVDWRDQAVLASDVRLIREQVGEIAAWINRRRDEVGRDQQKIEELRERVDKCERRLNGGSR